MVKRFIRNHAGAKFLASGKGIELEVVLEEAPTSESPVAKVNVYNGRHEVKSFTVPMGGTAVLAPKFELGVLGNEGNPQVYFKAGKAYGDPNVIYPTESSGTDG